MKKFLELTGFGNNEKHLISLDSIMSIHFDERYTSITLTGGLKINVNEDEDIIRELLKGGSQSTIVSYGDFLPQSNTKYNPVSEEEFLKSLEDWMDSDYDVMLSPEEVEDMEEIKSALRGELGNGGGEEVSLDQLRLMFNGSLEEDRDIDEEWDEYERGELPI